MNVGVLEAITYDVDAYDVQPEQHDFRFTDDGGHAVEVVPRRNVMRIERIPGGMHDEGD